MFGWHVPCCEAFNFNLHGSMFTGVARAECKALATQLALLRWQMHQQPWDGRQGQAVPVKLALGRASSGSLADSSGRATSSTTAVPPPKSQQTASQTVPDARQANDGFAIALSPAARRVSPQPLPARQLPVRQWRGQSGTADWVKAARAPAAAQPPLPSLAQLRDERVRDQRLREWLKGAILRRYGCTAPRSRLSLDEIFWTGQHVMCLSQASCIRCRGCGMLWPVSCCISRLT